MPIARSVPSDLSVLKKSLLLLERLPGVTSRFSQSNHSEAGRNKPIEGNPRVFQEFLAPLESRLRPAETHQRQPLSPLRNRAKATRKNRKVDSTGKASQDDNNRRSTRRTGFGMQERTSPILRGEHLYLATGDACSPQVWDRPRGTCAGVWAMRSGDGGRDRGNQGPCPWAELARIRFASGSYPPLPC